MASSGSPTSPSRPLLSLRTDAPAPLPSPSFSHWSSTQEGNLTSSPTHAAYPFPSLHFPSTSSLSFPADLPTPAHAAPPPPDSSTSSQRIFRQLELVKTLQEGIAREHSALEMIGLGECDWAAGTAGKEEGEKGRKESAQAYESMALEAEERHKGVEGIMEKLSALSSALKTFHALPSPVLFPSSSNASSSTNSAAPATAGRADTAPVRAEEQRRRPSGLGRRLSFTG